MGSVLANILTHVWGPGRHQVLAVNHTSPDKHVQLPQNLDIWPKSLGTKPGFDGLSASHDGHVSNKRFMRIVLDGRKTHFLNEENWGLHSREFVRNICTYMYRYVNRKNYT